MAKITAEFDPKRRITAYRIAAATPSEVDAEIDVLLHQLKPTWALFTPPILWGREYVAHGELTVLTTRTAPLRVQQAAVDAVAKALELGC